MKDNPNDERTRVPDVPPPGDGDNPNGRWSIKERDQLLLREREARLEAEVMRDANLALTRDLSLERTLETLLDYLRKLVPFDSANVMLVEGDSHFVTRAIGGYKDFLKDISLAKTNIFSPRTNALFREICETKQSLLVPDTKDEPRWQSVPGSEHVRNWIGVPLFAHDEIIGLYSLDKAQAGYFTAEHVKIAESLALPAASAILNAKLFWQVERHSKELEERVAESKKAEVEIRKQKEILQKIFDHIPLMISFTGEDGRVEIVNREWERTLGWSLEEIKKQDIDVFAECYPDPAYRQEVVNFISAAKGRWADFKTKTRDGPTLDTSWFRVKLSDGRSVGIGKDITADNRAEAAVRKAEQRYRDILDNVEEGIFRTSPEGRFILVNRGLAQMLGFDSPEELISERTDIEHQHYVYPEQRRKFQDLLSQTDMVSGFEFEAYCKDGSKIWLSENVRAVRGDHGDVLYYEGTTQDINERKLAEARSAAFATLARKLSGARTPLEAGIIIAHTAGDLFEWDSCNLDLYDADRDRIHPMLNIDTIDGQETDVTALISDCAPTVRSRRVIAHGAELELREEPIQFDKDAIPFGDVSRPSASIMTVPIRHAERVIGLFSIQSYTVHGYDQATLDDLQALADHCGEALNRIKAEQSLFESEERFRQMADHFEDVVWVANKDLTKVFYVNPAYERIFGRTLVRAGEPLDFQFEEVHPEDRETVQSRFAARTAGEHQPFEYRTVRPDGSIRWIHSRSFPIRNNDGEVYRVAGIAQDITERKRAEAALRESEERYRDLVESSRELIGTHDLDGLVLSANRATAEALGYHLNDFVGKMSIRDILAPEVRHQFDEYMARVRRDGETSGIMFVQTRSGERRALEFYNSLRTEGVSTPIVRAIARDITERRRAEEALSKAAAIVESCDDAIISKGLDGIVTSWNKGAARIYGHSAEEMIGRSISILIPSDSADDLPAIMKKVRRGEVVDHYETSRIRKDGKLICVALTVSPIKDASGTVIGASAIARDITEQKRAEESLQVFRNLIDQSNDAIEVIDPITLRFIDCNESAYRSLGYTREEFLSLTVFDIDPVVDRSSIAQLDEQINESGFATLQSVHLRKDGTTFPVEVNVKLVKLERVYRLAVVRDISNRKQAEEALRESEERYRELFENAKDAIYVHDLGGRYVSVNRAAEQLIGFSREEILGKHFSNFVSPRDLKHVRTNLCRKLDEENETIYEVNIVNRNGLRIPVEVSSRLIYEKGVAVGVQGTARDISDRKRAQEALRIYSQRLIEAQEAERQKIARELHDEIGQVLTAVRINLQSIQRSRGTDEDLRPLDESIAIVDEALGSVRELSIELRPSLLDDLGLSAALRWYVDRYAQRTGIIARVLNGFEEESRLPRDLETACFRIAQEALTNVARHAQASNVSVQLERSRERMLLTISDDGTGFDINELRKNASPAAALGLRGMEERALVLGGYIEIESGLECGTQIRATFPLKRK